LNGSIRFDAERAFLDVPRLSRSFANVRFVGTKNRQTVGKNNARNKIIGVRLICIVVL